jgi:putative flippase GtrA
VSTGDAFMRRVGGGGRDALPEASRLTAFVLVGALGFVLQVGVLAWLTTVHLWSYAVATIVAVEAAVLHNFLWHERWTWRDRSAAAASLIGRLLRFHTTTGITSIGGNLATTALGVEIIGLHPVIANMISVGLMSLANYLVADRWVFVAPPRGTVAALGVLLATASPASAAAPRPETLRAWDRHLAAVESLLQREGRLRPIESEPEGRTIGVPGGAIHEWRGSVLVRGVTVNELVDRLMHPGTPPPQDDVLESRVLGRDGGVLRVYLKLSRKAIVTVVYDTEHKVRFERSGPSLVTSRSASTSIVEAGGGDRGFLWRLNSYWTYRQHTDGVRVDVLALSLSRDVPLLMRPIAGPIIGRIARESMARTLEAVREFGERSAETQY